RPALLTSTSMPRKASGSASSAASKAPASRMSKAATCRRSPPCASTSACRRAARRPVAITRQPSSRKRRTAAAPKPAVAPVMRMVLGMGGFYVVGGGTFVATATAPSRRRVPVRRLRRRLRGLAGDRLLLSRDRGALAPGRRLAAGPGFGGAVLFQHALGQHHVLGQDARGLG